MKTKILIEDNNVSVTFSPETELERMCLTDLGDDIGVSHSHKSIVLRRRHAKVRKINDLDAESPLQAVRLSEAD